MAQCNRADVGDRVLVKRFTFFFFALRRAAAFATALTPELELVLLLNSSRTAGRRHCRHRNGSSLHPRRGAVQDGPISSTFGSAVGGEIHGFHARFVLGCCGLCPVSRRRGGCSCRTPTSCGATRPGARSSPPRRTR